jgi:hypothetical protein
MKRTGRVLLNIQKEKIEIEIIANNFWFSQNMQGERCMMMHDVTITRKKNETPNKILIGVFS